MNSFAAYSFKVDNGRCVGLLCVAAILNEQFLNICISSLQNKRKHKTIEF